MIATTDLRTIARARLRDAKVLLQAKCFDGAFYIWGYSVELALKARICQTLKTQDLEVLLRLSGVEDRVRAKHFAELSVSFGLESRNALSTERAIDARTSSGHGNVC